MQVQAARSEMMMMKLGFPQGGPISPTFFKEYSNDIPACVTSSCVEWIQGEEEDRRLKVNNVEVMESPISVAIEWKKETEKTKDEEWDRYLSSTVNKIEVWREENTAIGPEPDMKYSSETESAEATIYADDNSASEVGVSVSEVKSKTECMLEKIFQHIKANRLLINEGKTKVMLLATPQKWSKNNLIFHLDVGGIRIEEVKSATLLGVTLSNDFSWTAHIDELHGKCSKRLNGLYKVQKRLTQNQRKSLAEGSILSRLRLSIEIVSSCIDKCLKRIESMQSKSARYALGQSRMGWSKTAGYKILNWLTKILA